MNTTRKQNFILQQGFPESSPAGCPLQYSALQFQPRIIFVWLLAGILLQSPLLFAGLSAVLWWSALLPKLNPFELLFNRMLANQPGKFPIGPAPAPRRTAQAMAGTFALACAAFIYLNFMIAAYVVEAIFMTAVLFVTFVGFCFGSFVYHVFRGRGRFALRTLPWAR